MQAMRMVRSGELTQRDSEILFERRQSLEEIMPAVRAIMDEVRRDGDAALLRLTERFDGARLERLQVTPEEFDRADAAVDSGVRAALEEEIRAVRAFHQAQVHVPE